MKVTRIKYSKQIPDNKALTTCSVVLDDCLMLDGIRLFHSKSKGYYLVLPSKQDVYQEVVALNKDVELSIPKGKTQQEEKKQNGKSYEEYFYPLKSELYKEMLECIIDGYEWCKENRVWSYRPEKH